MALLAAFLLALASLIAPCFALAQPAITRPVTDEAGVLSPAEEETIAERLVRHREATGVHMAVLTTRTTGGEPIEDYAHRAAERWGGGSKDRDDGVLFVLAVSDRRMRLEVGYGLEPRIPDQSARRILDATRDALRAQKYGDAVLGVVDGVVERTLGIRPDTPLAKRKPTVSGLPLGANYPVAWFFGAFLGLVYASVRGLAANGLFRGSRPWEDVPDDAPALGGTADERPAPAARWGWKLRALDLGAWVVLPLAGSMALFGLTHGWAYSAVSVAAVATVSAASSLGSSHFGVGTRQLLSATALLSATIPPIFLGKFDGNHATAPLFCLLLHAGAAFSIGMAITVLWALLVASQSGTVLTSSGASSWSSGSTSRSWASRSTSSSSWSSGSSSSAGRSTSSSSSSSWGGGGGSFGGGGASASW